MLRRGVWLATGIAVAGLTLLLASVAHSDRGFPRTDTDWHALPGAALSHDDVVTWLAFRRDGHLVVLAEGSGSKIAVSTDVAGTSTATPPFRILEAPPRSNLEALTGIAVLDHKAVVVERASRTPRVLDLTSGRVVGLLAGHSNSVRAIVGTADDTVVTASDDGTVRAWDVTTLTERSRVQLALGPIDCVSVAEDGRVALVGLRNLEGGFAACLVDLDGRRIVGGLKHSTPFSTVDLLPAGAALCSDLGGIVVFDTQSGRRLRSELLCGPGGLIGVSSDRRFEFVCNSEGTGLVVKSASTGEAVSTIPLDSLGPPTVAASSADQRLIAIGTSCGAVVVRNLFGQNSR